MASEKKRYRKMEEIPHIRARPGMFIGSVLNEKATIPLADSNERSISFQTVTICDGLMKLLAEILSNVVDNSKRDPPMTSIRVTFAESGEITVWNNGDHIPVTVDRDEKIYIPELIFGVLRTSSNYDTTRIGGGTNGYGTKVVNIFSKVFKVSCYDPINKRLYSGEWDGSMHLVSSNVTRKTLIDGYTKVSFIPDWEIFKFKKYPSYYPQLIRRCCFETSMHTGLSVRYTGPDGSTEIIKSPSLSAYAGLYIGTRIKRKVEFSVNSKYLHTDKNTKETVTRTIHSDVVVAEVPSDSGMEGFQYVSFANGIFTRLGGLHVDGWANKIANSLKPKLEEKKISTTQAKIKNVLFVLVSVWCEDPEFDGQQKTRFTYPPLNLGKIKLDADSLDEMVRWPAIKKLRVSAVVELGADIVERKAMKGGTTTRDRKLDDANWAKSKDWKKRAQTRLIITEGDSAKGFAKKGGLNRDIYGFLPIRGKILNMQKATKTRTENSDVIKSIKHALGLVMGKKYESDTEKRLLRFGGLEIATDADVDGTHIGALLVNFFWKCFPALLSCGYVTFYMTPAVKVNMPNKKSMIYWYEEEFKNWFFSLSPEQQNKVKSHIKYYKGLGTHDSKGSREYFRNPRKMHLKLDSGADDAMRLAFSSNTNDRKTWIQSYDPTAKRDTRIKMVENTTIENRTVSNYINRDLILHANDNCGRTIPRMEDGLKPVQRKVIWYMIKKRVYKETKVVQLAGAVMKSAGYHHGDTGLYETIAGMAQDHPGSNNCPLIIPMGQFGSRDEGGKDAAQPRYISTALRTYTETLFSPYDYPLYTSDIVDGNSVEPIYYLPILPLLLLNGCQGIGTGYSGDWPSYNPVSIAKWIIAWITDKDKNELIPWWRCWTGTVELPENAKSWFLYGKFEYINGKVTVTEIPWTMATDDYKYWLECNRDGVVYKKNETKADKKEKRESKEPKVVSSFDNYSTEITPRFEIEWCGKDEPTHSNLRLIGKFKAKNMVAFDHNGRIKNYGSVVEYLEEWCELRKQLYIDRRIYQLGQLTLEIGWAKARIEFLRLVREKEIDVANMTKVDLNDELTKREFPKKEDSFKYLTDLKLSSFLKEKFAKLQKALDELVAKKNELEGTSWDKIWRKEIVTFLKEWKGTKFSESND